MYECRNERRCCNTIIRYANGSRGPRGLQGENAITDMARIYTAYPGPVFAGTAVGTNIPLILNSSVITPASSSAISFTDLHDKFWNSANTTLFIISSNLSHNGL